ncbi:helix-turn-helix transcriptional regulator [Lentzea flaviverrucosa]|uniref:Proteasome accessory factor C n=1 Tax=Lentzea flaviverrucosa TaxID=200379 RepID=A0A1H9XBT9_9PSEU|nr:YafY family protein [Lentzea flaviverrucosa]RDI21619.1 proteasome accessory factor C [Lentzea flaviverrucosa]SES43666.1 proteasome accessory factor C [Lentzea flaviverrucosa]
MTASNERLPRLLALVPYLLNRPAITVKEAAADFGITPKQLRKDLELLWMCGLPGYGPGDLIDLSFEGETITVSFDAGLDRPLRLTAAEAASLLVALRALADTPGVVDTDAVQRALAKIEAAVGKAQPAGMVVGLGGFERGETAEIREAVQSAVKRERAVRIRYYSQSHDAMSDRVVDPMRLLLVEGRGYLEGWCRSALGVRLFRLDRIDDVQVLDEPSSPPPHAQLTDTSEGLFHPRDNQKIAVLLLEPDAHWVAEYYPVDHAAELSDGRTRVLMRYDDPSWMVRLLLGLGGDVHVEKPSELAEEVVRQAAEALRRADHLLSTQDV